MRAFVRPHGEIPGHQRREIAGGEADHRIVAIERGYDHLSDFTFRHGIAGAGPNNLDDDAVVHDHAFARFALVSDNPQLGRGVALKDGNAAPAKLVAQRRWQRGARDEAALERGRIFSRFFGGIEQDFQEVRRTDISCRFVVHDRLKLLLCVSDTAGDNRATKCMRAQFQNETAGREVIGK